MAKTLDELRAAITALYVKVEEDVDQTAQLVVATTKLLEKLNAGSDFQAEVDAVTEVVTKLTSDNPAVQAAIDAANA